MFEIIKISCKKSGLKLTITTSIAIKAKAQMTVALYKNEYLRSICWYFSFAMSKSSSLKVY